jgi:flagellar hook-associated protein 2
MAISVDGIVSGINTSSLISDLVGSYSAPKNLLQREISDNNALQESLTGLSSRLGDMQSALEDLSTEAEIREYSVNYTETDAFIAEATGAATEGVYAVEVSALATSELEVSQGFADTTSTGVIAEGTLDISYDGVTHQVTVDSTNSSLSDLAAEINDISGLSSYVMNTGDATNPYRLVVQGTDTGSSKGITIDTAGLTGGGAVPSFTEQVAASDAQLSINGISVTSESNTVSDSIQGFSLTLTGLTSSPVDVAVSLDQDAVKDKIQSFVDAYNEVIDYVDTNSVAGDEEAGIEAGIFNGDSSVRRIISDLQSKVTTQYSGMGTTLDSLGLIGVQLDNSGKLSIDSADFTDALADNLGSVMEMFTSSAGFGQRMATGLDVYIDSSSGIIQQRNDSIDMTIDSLEEQVGRWEERILSYESRLRTSFNAFESAAGALQGTAQFISSYFFSE